MKRLITLVIALTTTHAPLASAWEDGRVVECDGPSSSVFLGQVDHDRDPETPTILQLRARYIDYQLQKNLPVFSPSVHGMSFTQRLEADNDGTIEHMTVFLSPQVLMGPSSASIFQTTMIFSRRYLYLDTTSTHTESFTMRCTDSAPWDGGTSHEGVVTQVSGSALVIADEHQQEIRVTVGAYPPIVTISRGIEGGLELVEVGQEVKAVVNSQGELVKVYVYSTID